MVTINDFENIYAGKNVFLTGHTGFKGSWFLKILTTLGAKVKGYSLAPENENDLYNLIKDDQLHESVYADLLDKNSLRNAIKDFQPDFIFHFAAQPLVRLSYEKPIETFETNIIGTANLLESIKIIEKKCSVVIITTDKVYHNNEWQYPYRENDKLGGYDPYSSSKACAELVINSYRNSFFNLKNYSNHKKGIAVARAGNVIGGGDWSKDRLIPDTVKGLISKKTVIIRSPDSVRPWQHVLEPLIGYLLLGIQLQNDPKKYSSEYNFGPHISDTLKVKEMINLSINHWGDGKWKSEKPKQTLHEAGLLKLDISKSMHELSWQPLMNARQAIQLTMDWYKEYNKNIDNISNYTLEQIKYYFSLIK